MATIAVGIIDVRRKMEEPDVAALTHWVVFDSIAMLTGFFGCCPDTHTFVAELAVRTRAVSFTPIYQAVTLVTAVAEGWLHPSFYLLYGFYRQIKIPDNDVAVVPPGIKLGELWDEMLPLSYKPRWYFNEEGSAYVHNLGFIKIKEPDWERWFSHCFQTCFWLGTSTPSKSSQLKQSSQYIQGKKNKWKGKGYGKW